MVSFAEKVYEVVRKIPKGKVSSYGAIARCIGSGRSSRMVGWVLNHSGMAEPPVPAHRVVNRNGLLSGKHHFPGENLMQSLLENEGIKINDNQEQDFDKVFWDPMQNL